MMKASVSPPPPGLISYWMCGKKNRPSSGPYSQVLRNFCLSFVWGLPHTGPYLAFRCCLADHAPLSGMNCICMNTA